MLDGHPAIGKGSAGLARLGEDQVDIAQPAKVTSREALLVGNEHVDVGRADPSREDAFEMDDAARTLASEQPIEQRPARNPRDLGLDACLAREPKREARRRA